MKFAGKGGFRDVWFVDKELDFREVQQQKHE